MTKQYLFLVLTVIMLYSIFLISKYKYKEYKVNIHIESIENLLKEIKIGINKSHDLIKYKKSPAYRNKILKEEQGLKNKGEVVIYLTPEKKYNKFTKEKEVIESKEEVVENTFIYDNTLYLSIFKKWMHLLFNK